jgi:cell division septation protein DedD
MKTNIFNFAKFTICAAVFLLSTVAIDSVYAQEASSSGLKMVPSQERIPSADWRINPEYIIPPIGSQPSSPVETQAVRNSSAFKAPLINGLERGKWYVQIGAYTKPEHVEDAITRAGTASPIVILNVGTEINAMFRVLLGPFTQSESKTILQRFRDKGYEAFLRSGN